MADLSAAQWDELVRRAWAGHLLARLAAQAQELDLTSRLPATVQHHLAAASSIADHCARTTRWEINRIERALRELSVPVLLLKGAAYVAAGLPAARGRVMSDTDIMVPRASLAEVEATLKTAGWQPLKVDPYDQRYYRKWMHELPPLVHRERGTVVDVHHSILPPTARLKPAADKLWSKAERLSAGRCLVLAPTDLVLHSACHLFHDGDLHRALRELVDVGDLVTHFGQRDNSYWSGLVPRASALGLGRPLFYALRYCQRLLRTAIPADVLGALAAHAAPGPALAAMDRLVPRTLIPGLCDRALASRSAAMSLYVRSHWLRMPPWLLAHHLARQAIKRLSKIR
jgi:Uncharacterised nucleotidyltransferase